MPMQLRSTALQVVSWMLLALICAHSEAKKVPEYVPGSVVVTLKSSTGANARGASAEMTARRVEGKLKGIKLQRMVGKDCAEMKITDKSSVEATVKKLQANPDVLFAEPNFIYRAVQTSSPAPSVVPNDPDYGSLWGMPKISAPQAWARATGNSERVCVIDTGVNLNHPDLIQNLDPKYRFNAITNNKSLTSANDDNGHGSHCAGTVAARGNNRMGVVGVAWDAKIVPCKFMDSKGSGTLTDAVECIDWCRELGIKIFSNSWGASSYSSTLASAVERVSNSGGLFVAAAGNSETNNDQANFYPAGYNFSGVISVASTTNTDILSGFSNYGRSTVHIAAPGSLIYSTHLGSGYEWLSGTSMATPHVAGAAALLLGASGALSGTQIKKFLLDNVDVLKSLKDRVASWGRLNVAKALTAVLNSIPSPSPTPSPMPSPTPSPTPTPPPASPTPQGSTPASPSPSTACTMKLWDGNWYKGGSISRDAMWSVDSNPTCVLFHKLLINDTKDNWISSLDVTCVCNDNLCQTTNAQTAVLIFDGTLQQGGGKSFKFAPSGCSTGKCTMQFNALQEIGWNNRISSARICFGGATNLRGRRPKKPKAG